MTAIFYRISGAALALTLLSGCVVDDGPTYVGPPPAPAQPDFCTMVYQPVCGIRAGQRETLSNACVARSRGFDVIAGGECPRLPPDARPISRPGFSQRPPLSRPIAPPPGRPVFAGPPPAG